MINALIKYVPFSRLPILSEIPTMLRESRLMTEFSPTKPIQIRPKLCINCKHFFEEGQTQRCSRFGSVDNIDGTVYYTNIRIAREYDCRGKYYEAYDSNIKRK